MVRLIFFLKGVHASEICQFSRMEGKPQESLREVVRPTARPIMVVEDVEAKMEEGREAPAASPRPADSPRTPSRPEQRAELQQPPSSPHHATTGTTPVMALSPPPCLLSPQFVAPANTPTCHEAAARQRSEGREQGVLREAATRLQNRCLAPGSVRSCPGCSRAWRR